MEKFLKLYCNLELQDSAFSAWRKKFWSIKLTLSSIAPDMLS